MYAESSSTGCHLKWLAGSAFEEGLRLSTKTLQFPG